MADKKIPDEVIQTALMINLPRFLQSQGIELKAFNTCWEYGSGAEKVTVWQDRRDGHYQWKRQYDRMTGNAIQWLQAFGGLSFVNAVFHLYDWAGGRPLPELKQANPAIAAPPVEEKKKRPEFRLPPANKNFNRVMAYLCQTRKINPRVVKFFHVAGLIYESAIYHNAVFVGRDKDGVPRHANLRGTITNEKSRAFKMNQECSDPSYGFHWVGTSPTLFVFEAPIDVLSFITLYPQNWEQNSYTALCGTFPDAMLQFLQDHPNIRMVYLCCDNDDAGHKGNMRCANALDKAGIPYKVLIPRTNDWNDDLKEVSM